MTIYTSKITTNQDGDLSIDPNGTGEVKLTKLAGQGEVPLSVNNTGEVGKLDNRDLTELEAVTGGDIITVQRGDTHFKVDADEFVGGGIADPTLANVSWIPSQPPGSGTLEDPFVLTPAVVATPGGAAGSIEQMALTGLRSGAQVLVTEQAGTAGLRFEQGSKFTSDSGAVAPFSFVYNDTPASTTGKIYNGLIRVGSSIYISWEVTQVANNTIFGPGDGQPTASPASVNYPGDEKFGTVTGVWQDGSRTLRADNIIFGVQGSTLDSTNKFVQDGQKVAIAFDATVVAAASEGDLISGALTSTDETFYFPISMVKDVTPAPYSFNPVSNVATNTEATTGLQIVPGFNAPTTLDATGGTTPLTSIEVSVNGATRVAASGVAVNPGDTIELFGTTGGADSTTYTADVSLGGVIATWSVTTAANTVDPTIGQPSIISPIDGSADLTPNVIVTSSTYNPLNGAGAHSTTTWEVYEAEGGTVISPTISNSDDANAAPLVLSSPAPAGLNGAVVMVNSTSPTVVGEQTQPDPYTLTTSSIASALPAAGWDQRVIWSDVLNPGGEWTHTFFEAGFDGSIGTGTNAAGAASQNSRTITGFSTYFPSAQGPYTVEVAGSPHINYSVNGEPGISGQTGLFVSLGIFNQFDSLAINTDPASGAYFAAIRVNGRQLVNQGIPGSPSTIELSFDTPNPDLQYFKPGDTVVNYGQTWSNLVAQYPPQPVYQLSNFFSAAPNSVNSVYGGRVYTFGPGDLIVQPGTNINVNGWMRGGNVSGAQGHARLTFEDGSIMSLYGMPLKDSNSIWNNYSEYGNSETKVYTGPAQKIVSISIEGSDTRLATNALGGIFFDGVKVVNGETFTQNVQVNSTNIGANKMVVSGGIWNTANTAETWSDSLVAVDNGAGQSGVWYGPAYYGFDGNLASQAASTGQGASGTSILRWNKSVSNVTSLAVYLFDDEGGQPVTIELNSNGNTTTVPQGQGVIVRIDLAALLPSIGGNLTNITVRNFNIGPDSTANIAGIELNGRLLVDPVNSTQVWSDGTIGSWTTGYDATNAFNGSLDTFSYSSGAPAGVNFSNLVAYSKIEVYGRAPSQTDWQFQLNGATVDVPFDGSSTDKWTTVTTSFPVNVERITNNNGNGRLYAIRIDGKQMVDTGERNIGSNQVLLPVPETRGTVGAAAGSQLTLTNVSGRWIGSGSENSAGADFYVATVANNGTPGAPTSDPPGSGYTAVTPAATTLTTATLDDTNLDPNKYYFSRVKYSDGSVESPFSAYKSFRTKESFIPEVGEAYGGGYFAGQINDSGVIYNLIICPTTNGVLNGQYGGSNPQSIRYRSENGPGDTAFQNTSYGRPATEALGNSTLHPLFYWCKTEAQGPNAGNYDTLNAAGTGIGGFNDWYIPALNELLILYYFLKPTTTPNDTRYGSNSNAVAPYQPNSNFTSSVPSQTSSSLFVDNGTPGPEALSVGNDYWTSSQEPGDVNAARFINVSRGTISALGKSALQYARCIRREAA